EQRREIDRGCRRIKDGAAASGELSGSRTNRPPLFSGTPNTPPHAIPSPLTPVASKTALSLERSGRDQIRPRRRASPAATPSGRARERQVIRAGGGWRDLPGRCDRGAGQIRAGTTPIASEEPRGTGAWGQESGGRSNRGGHC